MKHLIHKTAINGGNGMKEIAAKAAVDGPIGAGGAVFGYVTVNELMFWGGVALLGMRLLLAAKDIYDRFVKKD